MMIEINDVVESEMMIDINVILLRLTECNLISLVFMS